MIYTIDYANPSDFKNDNNYVFINYNDFMHPDTYFRTIINNKDKINIVIYNQPNIIKKLNENNIQYIKINDLTDIKKDVQ